MPTWPFPTRDPTQFQRIDEGWDLQAAGTTPVPVLAAAPGVVTVARPNPTGFGNDYPLLHLDTPVTAGGKPRDIVYYGHTHVIPAVIGQHVGAGTPIAMTGGLHSGGDAYTESNWLEIGFWPPSWSNGQAMKDWISSGDVGGTGPAPAPGTTTPAATGWGILPEGFGKNVASPAWWFRVALAIGGGLLVLVGSWVLVKDTPLGHGIESAAGPAGKLAGALS